MKGEEREEGKVESELEEVKKVGMVGRDRGREGGKENERFRARRQGEAENDGQKFE